MKTNGELKILLGLSLITVNYAIYMTCTPDPADGMVLAGVIGAIAAIVGGVGGRELAKRKLRYD